MTSIRLSLSLPDEAHPNLEVSVDQPGSPDMVFSVPLAQTRTIPDIQSIRPARSMKVADLTDQEEYDLGGYAGI